MHLSELTAAELVERIKTKDVSAVEVVQASLDRIENINGNVGAFLRTYPDYALTRARQIDEQIASGVDPGPLAGLPIGIKDNICESIGKTTCASKILENYSPPYDAHVVEKLVRAGAVIVGKTNLDEFAMGSSTENSGLQRTYNPWDLERVPGGSSGGSASAVAARMVPVALGSDTGGSIRQPASLCGVFGLKPTYGRVSRYGLVAYGSSLDQIGPFANDINDIALLMNVLSGQDPKDSTSVPADYAPVPNFVEQLHGGVAGLKIGLPKEYYAQGGLDPEVRNATNQAIQVLKDLGAELVEISLPHTDYALACYYLIATAEASSNLARYDGIHYGHRTANPTDILDVYFRSRAEGFGEEVKRRIMLGTYALSAGYYDAYYLKALKVRTLIKRDFENAFERVDVICCPASPTAAFKIGEKIQDPLTMYLSDIFTLSANLAGIPGLSVPCGFTRDTLPIGLQILGKHFDEATMLRAACAYQQVTHWHRRQPKIARS
jgi:aspartyl-tRNA(Asn)/glutamyl-tRNA(Gln) amidotransferase subunit A